MTDQPYLMPREQWEKEVRECREAIRGNFVQMQVTRGCMSGAVSASKRLEKLHFGVKEHLMAQVEALRQGKTISGFANLLLIARLDRPVRYCDVRNQARRLGLLDSTRYRYPD